MAPGTLLIMPRVAHIKKKIAKLGVEEEVAGVYGLSLYCVVTIGTQRQTTEVAKRMGKDPVFNTELTYLITVEDIAHFEIWDKDKRSADDFICEGSFAVQSVPDGRSSFEIPLRH